MIILGRGPGTVQFHTNTEDKGEDKYVVAKVVRGVGVVSAECENLQTKECVLDVCEISRKRKPCVIDECENDALILQKIYT